MEACRCQTRGKARRIKGERRDLLAPAARARRRRAERREGHGSGAADPGGRDYARGRELRDQSGQARGRELPRELYRLGAQARRQGRRARKAALPVRASYPEIEARRHAEEAHGTTREAAAEEIETLPSGPRP